MVVTFDAVSSSAGHYSSDATAGLTFAHTCGATATLLIVPVSMDDVDGGRTVAVTYDGVSMTAMNAPVHSGNSTYGYAQVFYLANPPTGAAYNVVITTTGAASYNALLSGAVSYSGAGVPTNVATAWGLTTPVSNAVDVASGEMAGHFGVSGSSFTGTESHTERWTRNVNNFSEAKNASYQDTSSTGTPVTLTLTNTSDWWAGVAFTIPIPASVATTPAWLGWFTPFGLAKSWFDTDLSLEGWSDEEDIVEPTAGSGVSASATLAASSTITAAGSVAAGLSASATVAETATITAAGTRGLTTSASVVETSTVTATGVVGRSTSASVSETATLTSSGAVGRSTSATVTETAAVTATGQRGTLASVSVSETVTITAAGSVTAGAIASATVIQTATITAAGVVGKAASATVTETVTLTGAGTLGKVAAATVTQTVTLTAAGVVAASSAAAVAQTVTITTTGTVDTSTGAVLTETVTITAAGSVLVVIPTETTPERTLTISAETRRRTITRANRTRTIDTETRNTTITTDNRTETVPRENRSLRRQP